MEEIEKIATEIPEDICDIEIDFYGRKLAVGSSTGKIYIFENLNGNYSKVSEISAHIGPIFKLSWSHPSFGPILASCGFDKKVNLYKIDPQYKLEKIYEHDKHNNCITALKFSPSSNNLLLISGDLNGNIIACEYLDKDFGIKEIFGHDFGVNSIDFFDDKTFVTCGNDNIVKIWNYLNENGNVEIKIIFVINNNYICTKDLYKSKLKGKEKSFSFPSTPNLFFPALNSSLNTDEYNIKQKYKNLRNLKEEQNILKKNLIKICENEKLLENESSLNDSSNNFKN